MSNEHKFDGRFKEAILKKDIFLDVEYVKDRYYSFFELPISINHRGDIWEEFSDLNSEEKIILLKYLILKEKEKYNEQRRRLYRKNLSLC